MSSRRLVSSRNSNASANPMRALHMHVFPISRYVPDEARRQGLNPARARGSPGSKRIAQGKHTSALCSEGWQSDKDLYCFGVTSGRLPQWAGNKRMRISPPSFEVKRWTIIAEQNQRSMS
ncbi:hypothetical protein CIHG_08667 [Coccidioides immitis H538.4]|uniref:Uncharacterized protein n=3 Tax=Coccidioides immitis TaxID=5501 RepID=A0A0J8TU68_COCIT|nr:hypothetical protein CIRG_02609 [Coccidioides immitis RMSCC 2394]KMU77362.1 hypothetical protein CISG_06609 [Coccidioides immitis RMSCC 3703]KMU90707.1 hypothetical protein CIHG_08667 [Coccidioides immitis H538.4]